MQTSRRPRRQAQPRELRRLTIDALARAAGTTSRNVRALQVTGVLKAPVLVGRTGYYGPADLARLRATLRLQDRGYSRAAIADLLDAWEDGRTLEDVLGLPVRRRRRAAGGEDDWSATFDELAGRRVRNLAAVPGFLLPR